MINIIATICISLIIIVCIICYTVIKIRHGNYKDIVLNDNTYQAAIAECNKMSSTLESLKKAADYAQNSLMCSDTDVIVKLNIADYLIKLIKSS